MPRKFFTALPFIAGVCMAAGARSQNLDSSFARLERRIDSIVRLKAVLEADMEQLKLTRIRQNLKTAGLPQTLPGNTIIWHSAMALEYAEPYEQARWVAHIIPYDVTSGTTARSNDFRPDSAISTGSAVEADYFLKFLQPDSSYKYDGFGYDRGHLAPSADFRWSAKALSESYFYSNMSPQLPAFNREAWGAVEDKIRGYLYGKKGTDLYVLTGPVLTPGLKKIERGPNNVSIPELYWKVVADPLQKKGAAFIMPNRAITQPLHSFMVPIDSVERLTGMDFFNNWPAALQQAVESQRIATDWFPDVANGDVDPVPAGELKRGQINTTMAKNWMGDNREIMVCGMVVGGRLSRAGNILLNLDKQFPGQVFTVFIKKEDIANFTGNPVEMLKGKRICVQGRVNSLDGLPVMYIRSEKDVR
jgi:endonuclease G, mitochondrial